MNVPIAKSLSDSGTQNQIRILIVDDDLDILHSLQGVLELQDEKHIVRTALDAPNAKRIVKEFCPDITLLDIKLGYSNGLDLVPAFKKEIPEIVCIMMTAYRDAEYAVTAVRFGADDYLYKPLDPDKLLRTIEYNAEKQRLWRNNMESERHFRTIFEQTFQLVFLLDVQGMLLKANETALAFAGLTKDDVIRRISSETQWWNGFTLIQQCIRDGFNEASTEGKIICGEVELKDCYGKPAMFDYSIKPVVNDNNQTVFFVVECSDITAHKHTETLLLDAYIMMEGRMIERTAELEKMEKIVQQANHAKNKFLGRMSHELRTPMNAILGFGQLLDLDDEQPLSPEQKESVKEILRAGEHLLELINEVLGLAEIESGKYNVSMEDVQLMNIIQACLSLVGPLAKTRGILIDDRISGSEQCNVHADPKCLRQILINLISNAVKYNREQGRITLSCEKMQEGRVRICVTDTGTGIAKEKQHRLFEPFDRLDVKDYEVAGVGIGLTVAKKLVEMMGGSIGVESTPGRGSTFWIVLAGAE